MTVPPNWTNDEFAITSIIKYMQETKSSRYDIDLYLLKRGYRAADIELAWEQLSTKTVAPTLNRRRRLSKKQKIKRGAFLAIAILLFVLFYSANNPALLDPLPAYLGTELLNPNFDSLISKYECSSYVSIEQVKSYKIFVTTDSLDNIFDFYNKNAPDEKVTPNRLFSTKLDCFYTNTNPFSEKLAVNAVIVLDQSVPDEAAIIAKAVPKITPDTKLLIVIQGFGHDYTDDQ
jgi:hypothetical protein